MGKEVKEGRPARSREVGGATARTGHRLAAKFGKSGAERLRAAHQGGSQGSPSHPGLLDAAQLERQSYAQTHTRTHKQGRIHPIYVP